MFQYNKGHVTQISSPNYFYFKKKNTDSSRAWELQVYKIQCLLRRSNYYWTLRSKQRQDRKEDPETVFDLLHSDHWTVGMKTIINEDIYCPFSLKAYSSCISLIEKQQKAETGKPVKVSRGARQNDGSRCPRALASLPLQTEQ